MHAMQGLYLRIQVSVLGQVVPYKVVRFTLT